MKVAASSWQTTRSNKSSVTRTTSFQPAQAIPGTMPKTTAKGLTVLSTRAAAGIGAILTLLVALIIMRPGRGRHDNRHFNVSDIRKNQGADPGVVELFGGYGGCAPVALLAFDIVIVTRLKY